MSEPIQVGAKTAYVLTEDDVRIVKNLLERERQRPKPVRPQTIANQNLDVDGAASAYVALCPDDGIPASTGALSGTSRTFTPGVAECDVYAIAVDGEVLAPVYSLSQRVFNLGRTPATGLRLVIKDRYGKWWVTGDGDDAFKAVVLSGDDAGGYYVAPIALIGRNGWTVTGPAVFGYRAPSAATGAGYPPRIPPGQTVEATLAGLFEEGLSGTSGTSTEIIPVYEITPWGGMESVVVVTDVQCVAGSIVVTKQTLWGRDLYLVPV